MGYLETVNKRGRIKSLENRLTDEAINSAVDIFLADIRNQELINDLIITPPTLNQPLDRRLYRTLKDRDFMGRNIDDSHIQVFEQGGILTYAGYKPKPSEDFSLDKAKNRKSGDLTDVHLDTNGQPEITVIDGVSPTESSIKLGKRFFKDNLDYVAATATLKIINQLRRLVGNDFDDKSIRQSLIQSVVDVARQLSVSSKGLEKINLPN